MEKEYVVGERTYVQRPLVLGQIRQLINELGSMGIDPTSDKKTLVATIVASDKLERVLAIVLTPKGEAVRDKDLAALAKDLEFDLTPEQIMAVVDDFFDCNPTVSILEKLIGIFRKVKGMILETKPKLTGLNLSSASSPAEILPDEKQSSGVSPLENADPT